MGIINNIKKNIEKSGTNKDKMLYVKADSKVRVRFLQELDDGFEFTFHDSYEKGVNAICLEHLGKNCPLCGDEDLRTRTLYAWSVYNYDTKKVEVMLFAVNNCTPVSGLLTMHENYGCITDRDYVLSKSGKQQNTQYTVIPQDKQKFRNEKAKPYTKSAVIKILAKAFPYGDGYEEPDEDIDVDEEDIVEEKATKKKSKKELKRSKMELPVEEAMEDDFDDDFEEDKFGVSMAEEILDDEDIDVDDFLEYLEVSSLKKVVKKASTEKKFKRLVNRYLDDLEEE